MFRIGKIRLGDVICYEVGFDNLVRSEVLAGANLLTVQTNDADFELDGQLGETLQQLAMARHRAIDHRPRRGGGFHHRDQRDHRAGRPRSLARTGTWQRGRARGAGARC